MKGNKKNKGFSLVELIVVIAVMAVLVGVLAPAYLRYVDKSRLQKDITAVGEVIEAIKVAAAEEEVLNDLTPNSESETVWTYVQIAGGEGVEASPITAVNVKKLLQPAINLQTAVTGIVGDSISFSREEVQNANIVLVAAYDADNFNITVNVDTSVFTGEVKEAFEEAFPHTAGASSANAIAAIQKERAEYNEKYNTFMSENQEAVNEGLGIDAEIALLETALENQEAAVEVAQGLVNTAQNTVNAAQSTYDWFKNKFGYSSTKYEQELADAKSTLAGYQTALEDEEALEAAAQAELDEAKARKTELQPTMNKYYELTAEGADLSVRELELYGSLGMDIVQ